MTNIGKLYLLPTTLGSFETISRVIPEYNIDIIKSLDVFIVEKLRTARRFLSALSHPVPIDSMTFYELNKHTERSEITEYLDITFTGKSVGLLSEAGTPCIADPGNEIVKIAHESGIEIVPLVGPNSIIMALMTSGFNGQNFCFHGYLPVDNNSLTRKLRDIESNSLKYKQTQIFIETPYRNERMLKAISTACNNNTMLCIATDISLPTESIITMPISQWKKMKPSLNKKPSVFLLMRY